MTIQTRFAPSPTGHLHVGNIRTALFNYLIARKNGGKFLLRIDDTDMERSSQLFEDSIKKDLEWLGIEWDNIEKQSLRFDRYHEVLGKLKSDERLYPCFETTNELELRRKKLLNMGKPPVYDRSALNLSDEMKKKCMSEGREPYWRFLLQQHKVQWDDQIIGTISVDLASVSDPVFVKEDGQFLYTIASVCDDIDFGITHVIRGSDHVTNTATQIQLLETMKSTIPTYAHHSLLTGLTGNNLSKRFGSLALRDLKSSGVEPMAIVSMLSALGSSKPIRIFHSFEEIYDNFELSSFGSAPTKFDPDLLHTISTKVLNSISLPNIKDDLRKIGIPENKFIPFWEMARDSITKRQDIMEIWNLCKNGPSVVEPNEDTPYVKIAFELLPVPPHDEKTWKIWTDKVSEATGRKGKALFMPLRQALTGKNVGPDMSKLMPLLQKIPLL